MNTPIHVLLVDDHAIVRKGYRGLLQDSGRVIVAGEAADASDAYQRYCEHGPDVVVMDISLPGGSGIAALERILARDPRACVLMFSMHDDAIFATHALNAGARGYITKSSAPNVLVDAVLAVAAGRRYLSGDIAQALAFASFSDEQRALGSLTEREFEVLRLSLDGWSRDDMAHALNLSTKSVANHRWSIKQKIGVDNFTQVLLVAMRAGLMPDQADAPPSPATRHSGDQPECR